MKVNERFYVTLSDKFNADLYVYAAISTFKYYKAAHKGCKVVTFSFFEFEQ